MNTDLLRQLYRKYQNEIYLYLYSLSHNRELAQDLMQETFLKAILSLSDDHTNMRAWLYLVARNLYFNYQKKERQAVPIEEMESVTADGAPSLPEQMIQDEQKKLLYQALFQLPERQREILQLHYFSNLSLKEIAKLLHQTPENIRVQAHRAKKELKSYLEVHGYDLS